MFKTMIALEDGFRERKEKLIRRPTWEEIAVRGIEAMEKEQAGFNLKPGK